MANDQVHALLRYVRQVIGPPDGEAGTDGQLLRRFVRHRDEAAFLALVQRHGPMVLGVCHRVLRQAQDAEDAFQATFLVLVRKAHTIADVDRLSNWLYGVAVRTASKLKVREARRRRRERRAVSLAGGEPEPDQRNADLCPVLDQEIQQLPTKYRTTFLLCYLEGKTNREAAAVLGCPAGTVSSRLAWARQRLRNRLARRGYVPAGVVGAGLAEGEIGQATAAAVPAELETRTVRLALEFAAGKVVAAGGGSLRAVILTREVLRAMFWTSWKSAAVAGLMAVGLIGVGAGVYASGVLAAGEPAGSPPAAQDKEPPKPEALQQEVARLQAELQKLQEEIAQLRAKLDAQPKASEPVLFRGKPAAYWIQSLKDRDPAYRADAVKALGGIAEVDRSVIPILARSLGDQGGEGGQNVGFRAGDALRRVGTAALPALQEALTNGTVEVRRRAAEVISQLGREGVPALTKALRDANASVVCTAAKSLLLNGSADEATIQALQAAARDNDSQRRRWVIESISEIVNGFRTPRGSVPILIGALNDPELEIQKLALGGLKNAREREKKPHPGAVPALLKLLKDPKTDKSLRKEVYELLHRMDPAAAQEALGLSGP